MLSTTVLRAASMLSGMQAYRGEQKTMSTSTCLTCLHSCTEMLLQMAEAGLQPHDSAYNSAMAALVNASKYEAALELLQRMQVSNLCV
jgi:pentatricopeptide repeat protein